MKPKHDYTCDNCGKPATINIGDTWHSYSISNDGDFSETGEWDGSESSFYCDKCGEEEGYL